MKKKLWIVAGITAVLGVTGAVIFKLISDHKE